MFYECDVYILGIKDYAFGFDYSSSEEEYSLAIKLYDYFDKTNYGAVAIAPLVADSFYNNHNNRNFTFTNALNDLAKIAKIEICISESNK